MPSGNEAVPGVGAKSGWSPTQAATVPSAGANSACPKLANSAKAVSRSGGRLKRAISCAAIMSKPNCRPMQWLIVRALTTAHLPGRGKRM